MSGGRAVSEQPAPVQPPEQQSLRKFLEKPDRPHQSPVFLFGHIKAAALRRTVDSRTGRQLRSGRIVKVEGDS